MPNPNLGQIVADAWTHMLKTTEDPFGKWSAWGYFWGPNPHTHQEYLDRQRINYMGEVIPRIEIVRHNLRRLGNIRLDPKRLR